MHVLEGFFVVDSVLAIDSEPDAATGVGTVEQHSSVSVLPEIVARHLEGRLHLVIRPVQERDVELILRIGRQGEHNQPEGREKKGNSSKVFFHRLSRYLLPWGLRADCVQIY